MPNKHCLLVDLSPFGQDNPNEIFVPTDEPHGTIEARVRRRPTCMKSSTMRRGEEIIARCRQIAAFTEVPGEITRTFLSPPMRDVHKLVSQWMESAGMTVSVDAAGNLRGLYPGAAPDSPRLLIGSHLDTVPNAGAFDGILGVVLGVAVVEQLNGTKLPFAIEVIGFSEEEGVRFGKPFLGSLALVGQVDDDITGPLGHERYQSIGGYRQLRIISRGPAICCLFSGDLRLFRVPYRAGAGA